MYQAETKHFKKYLCKKEKNIRIVSPNEVFLIPLIKKKDYLS